MSAPPIVTVQPNTMLADLDDGLRRLLRDQLRAQGFEDVDVVFDTPTRDWSAQLARPTVNLFLCDVRRSKKPGDSGPAPGRANGRTVETAPALRVDCAYAVSAWAKAVIDEHRLLSQVLGILHAHPMLDGLLGPRLAGGNQAFPITAAVAEDRSEARPEFWRSIDGTYKPALDYVVTMSVDAGVRTERGPDVRAVTVRTMRSNGPPRAGLQESHTLGGVLRDADGEPVAGAWVAITSTGRVAVTGDDGRFRLPGTPAGEHTLEVRHADGRRTEAEVAVPGAPLDLSV